MKFSWSQALPVAILALEVSAGKKCQHNPSGLSSTSSATTSLKASSTSSAGVTPTSSATSVASSSSLTTSSASSSVQSSSSSASTTSSETASSSSSSSSSSTSSSATLTQSSASATTLSSSIIIDKCSAGLLATTGSPDRASRLADCSALNMVTVTPPKQTTTTFTTTTTQTPTTITITNSGTSPAPLAKRTTVAGGVTGTGLDGTVTVRPTATPDYAGAYCDSYEQYYSACSDGGVTAMTTTAPGETATATSTVIITCVASYYFTQYLGIPFPTVMIPGAIPQATTIVVGGDSITTSIVGTTTIVGGDAAAAAPEG